MKVILEGTIMRRSLLASAAVLAVALATASPAVAGLVFSDDFNSADGPLAGTTPDLSTGNWTPTAAAATPIQIASGRAIVKTSGQDEYAAFSTPVPTDPGFGLRTSLDINVDTAQAGGDYFSHLSNPVGTTTNFYQRLHVRSSDSGFQLGMLETSGTGGSLTYGTTVLDFDTDYHVDIDWNFVAGPTNDTFDVYVNGVPYLSDVWTSVTAEPTQVSAANLRQGSSVNAALVAVDNLQVATIPEPATVALFVIGLVGFVCGRRR
jgi:hypothetical protein